MFKLVQPHKHFHLKDQSTFVTTWCSPLVVPSFPPLSALKYKWKLSPVLCAALPLAIINFRSHFRVNEASVSCSSSGHIHIFQVHTRAAVTQWGMRWSSPATYEAFWRVKDVQDWHKWYYTEIVLPFKRNPTRTPTKILASASTYCKSSSRD